MRVLIAVLTIVTSLLGAAPPIAADQSAASFDRVVALPDIKSEPAFVVDGDHIYVSLASNSVGVFDLDGKQVATLPQTATSLALSPDGASIWVSSSGDPSIVAYDTTTFSEVDRVTLPGLACPWASAQVGTYLVASDVCKSGEPSLTIVDLNGDRTPSYAPADIPESSWLGVSPALPNVVAGIDFSSKDIWTAEIKGGDAELIGTLLNNYDQAAMNPSAAQIAALYYGDPKLRILNLPGLEEDRSYPGSKAASYVRGVSYSGDGAWFATAYSGQPLLALTVYASGADTHSWQYVLEDEGYRAIGLNGDGSVMYLVTAGMGGDRLHIIDIDLANPPDPLPLLPGLISGRIIYPGSDDGAMGHVDLFDSEKHYLLTVDVRAGGYYSITDLDPGDYYLIMWNGDDETIWDYFPQWYPGAPLYRSDLAKPVTVLEDERTVDIDVTLPWLYDDMFGHVFQADIYWLGNTGITKGCNPPDNYLFCPDEYVTRGQMAAFINRGFEFDDGDVEFVDDDGSIFETDIERLAAAGITKGCNPPINDHFCPDALVTRGQMAAFMTRTFELVDRGDSDFIDDDGSVFEADIERLAAAGITKGCNPPVNDRFCPNDYVTRGQMAAFFHRGYENVIFQAPGIDSTEATQLPDRDVLTNW
jgi:hypothetical protein